MKKLTILLGGVAVLVLGLAGPAAAHVSPTISEAPAGGYATFAFTVPHGCDGPQGDTNKVEVQMPDGVESATPQQIPGWEATVDDSGPVVVTWEGGPLPHDQFLQFGVSIQMPDTPGETALFPTIQTCVSGEEIAWVEETPEGGEEPDSPAPAIAITESEGHSHGGGTEDEHGEEEGEHAEEEVATEAVAATDDGGDDGGSDGLAVAALIVGALGLLAGGYAVVTTRRAS